MKVVKQENSVKTLGKFSIFLRSSPDMTVSPSKSWRPVTAVCKSDPEGTWPMVPKCNGHEVLLVGATLCQTKIYTLQLPDRGRLVSPEIGCCIVLHYHSLKIDVASCHNA